MRNSVYLFLIMMAIVMLDVAMHVRYQEKHQAYLRTTPILRKMVGELGLSDLSISTEARYTRHPSVSDPVVPFMDHPGNIEHFPSGSFWFPVAGQ